jgi:hypothetical protein
MAKNSPSDLEDGEADPFDNDDDSENNMDVEEDDDEGKFN